MAKYVIAGKSDCPFFAKAELLADELQCRLPDFKVHKIVIEPDKWNNWIKETCDEKNWAYDGQSPIVWRELIDRGGKGSLVGSCNDFLEMANGYYGVKLEYPTEKLENIAKENKVTKEEDQRIEIGRKQKINPLKICVTAGTSDISYHILLALCNKEIFQDREDIFIHLLDDEEKLDLLQGICMELIDSVPTQLREIRCTTNAEEAFKEAEFIIISDGVNLLGNISEENSYHKLLKCADFSKIKQFGDIIGEVASENVRLIVAGGPCNIICNVLLAAAKNLKSRNCFALSRLHENKSKSQIASRLNITTAYVKDLIIWGQPCYNQMIDVTFSRVMGYDGAIWGPHIKGFSQDTKEIVHDEKWLSKELPTILNGNNQATEKSDAISYAAAIMDQLRDINNDVKTNEIHSLGIASEGWYGIPEGLVFSFPVKSKGSDFEIIDALELDDISLEKLKELGAQLKSECNDILTSCNLQTLQ